MRASYTIYGRIGEGDWQLLNGGHTLAETERQLRWIRKNMPHYTALNVERSRTRPAMKQVLPAAHAFRSIPGLTL
jgi:hypothetical protein